MDVWHWTPLVALLCFAGLRAIPDAYYQAASIDGASKFAVFRYIQLPKLRGVLMIAVLLRFMAAAAHVNLAFVAVSEKMVAWFGLEEEPSIWLSFIASTAVLAVVMRKG